MYISVSLSLMMTFIRLSLICSCLFLAVALARDIPAAIQQTTDGMADMTVNSSVNGSSLSSTTNTQDSFAVSVLTLDCHF